MQNPANRLVQLPRRIKRLIFVSLDLVLIPASIWLAYCLRLEKLYVPDAPVFFTLLSTTFVTVFVLIRLGLYRAVIRFASPTVLSTVLLGVVVSVLWLSFSGYLLQAFLPRSVPFIYFGIAMMSIGASRFGIKRLLTTKQKSRERVFIYGAGSAGMQLANALSQGHEYEPVAFLDDDSRKHKTIVHGAMVHSPEHIEELKKNFQVDVTLLAMSKLTATQKGNIVRFLTEHNLHVKTIPKISDIVSGKASFTEIRDIEVEELLGRDPVPPDHALLEASIRGKVVMVTGAGGSIGSELCRQVARLNPSSLVMVEQSEIALYNMEQELKESTPAVLVVAKLGDVKYTNFINSCIRDSKVQTIFHAAAYKHVPMVEKNMVTGAENNVLGTQTVGAAALSNAVENFVLVSTDKAVRPTNLMGASKRLAELIVQCLATEADTTRFSIVRFGNVLDSSGSVVPLFTKQIVSGGPVTVTHPEVTRYFMTIPEAVQLVIQSSAMGRNGDVFVLEMGEAVAIAKLAETMIRLLGKSQKTPENPDGEVEIVYTGLRPGEKLVEELVIGSNVVGTEHPRITKAVENSLTKEQLEPFIHELREACVANDVRVLLKIFQECVEGYVPSEELKTQADRQEHLILRFPTK